jgi:proteasome accessory factor A
MKRALLERLLDRNPGLDWHSPAIRAADLLFADLDPAAGLYWAIEAERGVEPVVSDGDIRRAMRKPPVDTRAWSRTMLLRQARRDWVESVNWDEIRIRLGAPGAAPTSFRFDDPRRFTRADMQRQSDTETNGADEPDAERISTETQEG